MNRTWLRWVLFGVVGLGCLFGGPLLAFAEEVQRTVVLKVKSGGTEYLTAEIESVPGIEVKDQSWFLKQVKSRGMKARKILQRPKDLRFVMSGSDIIYIVYVDEEDGELTGRVFGNEGALLDEVSVGSGAFDEMGASTIRELFERVAGIQPEEAEPIDFSEEVQSTPVATEIVTVEEEPGATARPRGEHTFSVGVGARLFKRDQSFAGGNNAVLNFESAFYPGFALNSDLLLRSVEIGDGVLGFALDVEGGFDSLVTDAEEISVLHLEALLGATVHFDGFQLLLGARHTRYSLSSNDVFPSIVHTVGVVGAAAEHRLGGLGLHGEIELHPWGLYGAKSATLFGSKASILGFGGRIGLSFAFSESLGLASGYRFRAERSSFPGSGSLDFSDSRGFELVHGPDLGLTWRR